MAELGPKSKSARRNNLPNTHSPVCDQKAAAPDLLISESLDIPSPHVEVESFSRSSIHLVVPKNTCQTPIGYMRQKLAKSTGAVEEFIGSYR